MVETESVIACHNPQEIVYCVDESRIMVDERAHLSAHASIQADVFANQFLTLTHSPDLTGVVLHLQQIVEKSYGKLNSTRSETWRKITVH